MKYENVYWDWNLMQNDGHYPSILAIGDSWFWYPFPGGSLLNTVGPLTAAKQHWVLALGNNGAEVVDYVYGKYSRTVRAWLSQYGANLSAVLLSGGGNDFAGFNDLRPLLEADCSGKSTPEACFRAGDEEHTLDWLMRKTEENYRVLIGQVFANGNPGVRIVLHNYDYPVPNGKGVFASRGAWLKPALDDARVPARLQRPCMKLLIQRFTAVLGELVKIDPQRIFAVDSTDTLDDADWANELHPKPAGFRKIARQKWKPVLVRAGLA